MITYMNLKTLPSMEYNSFAEQAASKREFAGLSRINKKDIYFPPLSVDEYAPFFKQGMHRSALPPVCPYTIDPFSKETSTWRSEVEIYTKLVWLTNEYIQDYKFKNPMGAHWNPTIQKFVIHPGSIRQAVFNLFGPEEATFITFNTSGIDIDWIKKYPTYESLSADYPVDLGTAYCDDHNTIIPHIHIQTKTISLAISRLHPIIKDFYTSTKIEANFDLSLTGYNKNIVKNPKWVANVEVDDPSCDSDILKAMMLLPTQKFYNHGVKIETTKL